MSDAELPSLVDERLKDWLTRSAQWYFIYYALGTLTVVLTITVASRPHFFPSESDWLPTLAWLAALFQGLSTFMVALPKAAAYRAAWRVLWLGRTEYVDSDKTQEDARQLRNAIARGWAIIDGGYTDAFRSYGRALPPTRGGKSQANPAGR